MLFRSTQGDSATSGRKLGVAIGSETQISTASNDTTSTFIQGQNYLKFSNVSVSAGTLIAQWWMDSGEANINGIQIESVSVVPAPGAFALIGAAGLVGRRRKA